MVSDSVECSNLQMLIRILIVVFLAGINPECLSGQLPTTNIYHFTMTKVGKKYRLKSPQFFTSFNKDGYNNQPSYFEDKVVYFTTDYYGGDQTEIAKFDLFDKTLTRITYTEEKEYSPTALIGKDGFSVVRVEADGETQTLSIYPLDGIGYPKRYMNNTSNIGYHHWLDDETVALFLVEEPNHNLAIAHAQSERRKIIIDKVGRCLKKDKKGNLLFVHKQSADEWYIKSYNRDSNKSKTILTTLKGVEDFELLNDGTFVMGKGSVIYKHLPGMDVGWVEMADLSEFGISNISRIASRKNSLILVNTE